MLARMTPALLLAALCPPIAYAADSEGGISSASFCLFELPGDGSARRFINLGIVQYLDLARDELRIVYGGGNLGSGHEARLPLKAPEEGMAIVQRMRQAARECVEPAPQPPPQAQKEPE